MKRVCILILAGVVSSGAVNSSSFAATSQDDKIVDSVCGMGALEGTACGLILRQHFAAIRNEPHKPTRKGPDFNILVMTTVGATMGEFNGTLTECQNTVKPHESFGVSIQCIPAHADTN